MAIPQACKSEEVAAAKARFDLVGMDGLKSLRDEDALLIGKAILMFSFNELNLRRLVEILSARGFLPPKKNLRTSLLVKTVKEGVAKAFPFDAQLSDDLAKLDEIELRWPFRNMFAHWAARRLDGMDSIVFMTKDSKDAKAAQDLNTTIASSITYAVMMIEDIHGLLKNIANFGQWLALRTSEWHLAAGGDS